MSMKLKVLGLGLLAVLATSAFAALNASATPSGHFTSSVSHPIITATENPGTNHQLFLSIDEGTPIECTKASYSGTIDGSTTTELTITPSYSECKTTTGSSHNVTVTMEGCDYTFFSQGTRTHGTATVFCPTGKKITVHHPNCTVEIGTQHALTGGLSYKQEGNGLTADVTVKGIVATYHSGICIFLGTNHTGEMNGAVTIKGSNTEGGEVKIESK